MDGDVYLLFIANLITRGSLLFEVVRGSGMVRSFSYCYTFVYGRVRPFLPFLLVLSMRNVVFVQCLDEMLHNPSLSSISNLIVKKLTKGSFSCPFFSLSRMFSRDCLN